MIWILINDDDDFEVDDETNIQLFVYKYQNAYNLFHLLSDMACFLYFSSVVSHLFVSPL